MLKVFTCSLAAFTKNSDITEMAKHMAAMTQVLIRYARQMLVRQYGTSKACMLMIFNYHLVTPVRIFTLLFVQFIRPTTIADDQKACPVCSYDVTREPCVFPRLQNRKVCENMRHEHAFPVLAWTRLELSTSSEPSHDR